MRWLPFLLAGTLCGAPAIRELRPWGAQNGTRLTVTVKGDGLTADARIESKIPGTISRLVAGKTAEPNSELPFLLELKKDAPVGLYPVRIITPDGVSNLVLFSVGPFQEIQEAEIEAPKQRNDSPGGAQSITVPATVNGTLKGADVDFYSFSIKAPQKLVFEIDARRAGSAVDPAFEILDSAGKHVAKADDSPGAGVDCRTQVSFTKPGTYRVRVHDARYSDQSVNFYRLKIGSYPYAESAFPLGWKKGEDTEVLLTGGNLPAPVKVKATRELRVPGSASLPLFFATGEGAEVMEDGSGRLTEDVVVNGQIAKAGEVDKYRMAVKPGEHWTFEVQAATLGTSQLDAILTLQDAAGKKLASRDDIAGSDPALPFTIPKGVDEITLAVEDVLGRGGAGYGYRLQAKRQGPDFVVDIVTPVVNVPAGGTAQVVAIVQRRGYDGPLKLTLEGLPEGFTAAGGSVPSEAAAQSFNNDNAGYRTATGVLTITAPENASAVIRDLRLVATGGGIRREARNPGLVTAVKGVGQKPATALWLEQPLLLATAKAMPVTIASPTPLARLSQGFEYPIAYRLKRRAGAKMPARVVIRQVGGVGNLRILETVPGENPDTGTILLSTNFATPVTTFDMVLEARMTVDGEPVTVISPAVSIDVVEGYHVELEQPEMKVAPGARGEIRGVIYREPTFEGSTVKLEAAELPEGVTCGPVEVPQAERAFRIACAAGAAAAPGSYEIQIRSVAPDTGRKTKDEYKIADVPAKLVVAAGLQAAR